MILFHSRQEMRTRFNGAIRDERLDPGEEVTLRVLPLILWEIVETFYGLPEGWFVMGPHGDADMFGFFTDSGRLVEEVNDDDRDLDIYKVSESGDLEVCHQRRDIDLSDPSHQLEVHTLIPCDTCTCPRKLFVPFSLTYGFAQEPTWLTPKVRCLTRREAATEELLLLENTEHPVALSPWEPSSDGNFLVWNQVFNNLTDFMRVLGYF